MGCPLKKFSLVGRVLEPALPLIGEWDLVSKFLWSGFVSSRRSERGSGTWVKGFDGIVFVFNGPPKVSFNTFSLGDLLEKLLNPENWLPLPGPYGY